MSNEDKIRLYYLRGYSSFKLRSLMRLNPRSVEYFRIRGQLIENEIIRFRFNCAVGNDRSLQEYIRNTNHITRYIYSQRA